MTRYGFFSVVCAHADRAAHTGEPHPSLMMIRARKHSHLEALRRFHDELGPVVQGTGTDYPYRIIADKEVVVRVVARLAVDVDYTNFKDTAYIDFLYRVWTAGLSLTSSG
jgi:hypothetical protein